MKFTDIHRCKFHLQFILVALFSIVTSFPAHAYFYAGGDWGGRDLSLLDGDTLSGNFSNVGQFYIPSGASISGNTDNLVVNANRFLIDGSLTGLAVPGYNMELHSLTDLILNGSINSWKSISISANQVILNTGSSIVAIGGTSGSVSLIGGKSGSAPLQNGASGSITLIGKGGIGDDYKPPQTGVIRLTDSPAQLPLIGGTISLVPTPIPAAAWLFGSGLLGFVGIRRRQG